MKMTMSPTRVFKVGDFVRINDSTHDVRMPATRMGHIIERLQAVIHYGDKGKSPTNVYKVFMTNGAVLNFHEMYFERMPA